MGKDKTFSLHTLLLIIFCLAVNILGARFAHYYKISLFLDAGGTILAAALGGYLPGIFVGFFSNYITSWSDSITLYYGILSILIAIVTVPLAKRGVFRKLHLTVSSTLIYAFIGGALGSLLTWALFGLNIGEGISAPIAIALDNSTNLGKFMSQLLADIGIDLQDKLVTVIAVYLTLKSAPAKFLRAFPLGYVYDKDYDPASVRTGGDKPCRRVSLRSKVGLLIIVTALVLSALSLSISYNIYQSTMNKRYTDLCKAAVNVMYNTIDADSVNGYLIKKERTSEYAEIEYRLYSIRAAMPDIKYMYVYQIRPDGCHVVFDLNTEDTPASQLGEVVQFDDDFKQRYYSDLLAGKPIDPVVTKGQYGHLMSVYRPLFDSLGKCVAYACADIAMSDVITDRYIFLIRMGALLFGVSILIVAFSIWFAERKIVDPLNSLAFATNKFAYDSDKNRKKNTERLRRLNIKTGDEIENLYSAVSKTTTDIFNYLRVIDEKSADIAAKVDIITKMQDNIIVSFANMVESRDENTGSHIKRTAAYVKAIAEEMSLRGRCGGTLTPDYIEKVEKSAPLHDIGKIRISDTILNKPGKLTQEEFETIKTHTLSGKEVLQGVFVGIEEDNYLSEAVSMALYHHEKWDGSGYPTGLAGEDIPLCARIMAVADVFDALVSKRSYKEPFPFDDAVKIIKCDAGTHFDPEVVAAFLNIKDKIREITEK